MNSLRKKWLITVIPLLAGSFCIIGILVYLEIEAIRDRLESFDAKLASETDAIESTREKVSESFRESIIEANEVWLSRSAEALNAQIDSIRRSARLCLKNGIVARFIQGDAGLRRYSVAELYSYLDDMIETHRLSEIVIVDSSGSELARRGEFIVPEGGDPIWDGYELPNSSSDESKQSWFLKTLQEDNLGPIHFDIYPDPNEEQGRFVLSVSYELRYDSGRFVERGRPALGYLQFKVPIERLMSLLPDKNAFGVALQVKDARSGQIVYGDTKRSTTGITDSVIREAPVIAGLLSIRSLITTEFLNSELNQIYELSQGLNRLSNAHADFYNEFDQANDQNRRLLVGSVFILLVSVSALIVRQASRLTSELDTIGGVARRVSEGDLSAKQKTPSSVTEFQELTKSIDQMRARLASHIIDLDAEVVAQTRKLTEQNDQLAQEIETRCAAENLAQQASQAKSEFLATMSHEIRTPLNGIVAMVAKLDQAIVDPSQREWIKILKVSSESLLTLINDVLDFTKIESGRMELECIPFSVAELKESLCNMFHGQFAERGIELRCDLELNSGGWLKGDPNKLRQILINLVGNALKFTESGFVRVALKTNQDPARRLVVEVEDSGLGIPTEAQSRLFKKFVQADSSTTRKHGGSGLGLAIIDNLVSLMEGSIQFTSALGEGTYFRVQLPLPIATESEVSSFQDTVSKSILSPECFEDAKILVVDDSQMNLRVAEILLQEYPFQVYTVNSGEGALEILEKEAIDLVFMDCQMPGMDGYQTAQHIRAYPDGHINKDLPVVALTGNVTEEGQRLCIESGMSELLSKPIIPEKLLEILQNLLTLKSKE
ncbi:MAG: ATP-binding protein [Verrucomicrobiota bacterium]